MTDFSSTQCVAQCWHIMTTTSGFHGLHCTSSSGFSTASHPCWPCPTTPCPHSPTLAATNAEFPRCLPPALHLLQAPVPHSRLVIQQIFTYQAPSVCQALLWKLKI